MGKRIRAFPWDTTPLGHPASWPGSLRSAVSICLNANFPTAIYWGPDLRLLYNDAWAPIPAERHPAALGQPGKVVWTDIWHIVGPQFQQVLDTGEAVSTFDQMLPMVRDGRPERPSGTTACRPFGERMARSSASSIKGARRPSAS